MNIRGFLWLDRVIEKIELKHKVTPEEVEDVFLNVPIFLKGPKGQRHGENGYYCLGRTGAGRCLFVFFIIKLDKRAMVISARDMTDSERDYYKGR